jgi:hypothetical protein
MPVVVLLYCTVAVLTIEPLGSMICGRSMPGIAERSQVSSQKMIDPSGSIIDAATVVLPDNLFLVSPLEFDLCSLL